MSFGGSQQATSSTINYTPDQKQVLGAANPAIKSYVEGGGAKMPTFSTVPNFNPSQLFAQSTAMDKAQGQLTDMGNMFANNAAFLGGPALDPNSNPYLKQTADAAVQPIYDDLMTKVLPTVRGEAVMNGMFGGSAQGIAESQGIEAASRAAGNARAGIYSGAYENGTNRMFQMLGMGDQIAGGITSGAKVADAVGQQQYAQEGAKSQEAFQRYMYDQMAPFLAAREGIAATMQQGVGQTNTTTTSTNPLQQALGAFMAVAPMML